MKKKEMKLQSEIITNMHELFGETLCSRTKTMHKTKLLHVMKTCSILSREVSESQCTRHQLVSRYKQQKNLLQGQQRGELQHRR
jgi:hypothetical protein